jgi:hypothetical protein
VSHRGPDLTPGPRLTLAYLAGPAPAGPRAVRGVQARARLEPARSWRVDGRPVGVFLGLCGLALLIAVFSGAALSWDGSYYLFKTLDTQRPYAPPDRLLALAPGSLVLLAGQLTSDVAVLQAVFGLPYAAVPLVSLVASWWVVRDLAPALFIWPALGVGVGLLPGLFFLVGEGAQAMMLVWPTLLAILLGLPRRHLPLAGAFALLTLAAHPVGGVLVLLLAVVALLVGSADVAARPRLTLAGSAMVVAAVARLVTTQQASAAIFAPSTYADALQKAASGLPLAALIGVWLTAVVTLLSARAAANGLVDVAPVLRFLAVAGLVAAAICLVFWARDPRYWANALDFSTVAAIVGLPFLALASAERLLGWAYLHADGGSGPADALVHERATLAQFAGACCLIVLTVQGVVFGGLSGQVRQVLASAPTSCVSADSLGMVQGTALGHWSLASYALVTQGRAPERIVLDGDGCVAARAGVPFRVIAWDVASDGHGWFDLDRVRARMAQPRGCWYSLSPGWYGVETGWYADWWRWSNGQGRVRVFAAEATDVTLRGDVRSVPQPNWVEIRVNGEARGSVRLAGADFQPLSPLAFSLQAGENLIEILSARPGQPVPNDSRPFAIAIKDLTIVPAQGAPCELQP